MRAQAETLRPVVAAVGALVDECRLTFGPGGIRVEAMDPANVAMVDVDLDASAFEAYETDGTVVGLDVARFEDLLGMAEPEQAVTLALDRERWCLHVRVGELAYTMGLYDPESVRRPPDRSDVDFEYPASLGLESATIGRFVRAAEMVADHLVVGVDEAEDAFYVEADGDTDDVSFVVPAADLTEFVPGDARSLFSISYLKRLDRAIPGGTEVTVRVGEDLPLAAEFDFADGDGAVEALVSPRIQST